MSLSDYQILPLTNEARNYLVNIRKLTDEVLEMFHVGCNARGEIAIPFLDEDNNLIGIKLRSPNGGLLKRQRYDEDSKEPEHYEVKTDSVKGSKPVLLGSHLPTDFSDLFICYGDYDSMSLRSVGIPAVSLPFGDRGTSWIERQWDWLQKFKNITFCPDYDDNPKTQAILMSKLEEMAKRLGKHKCFIIPEHAMLACKDINEVHMEYGSEQLLKIVAQRIPVPEPGLIRLVDYVEPEFKEGTPIGIPEIDKATGGHAGGGLTVISGDNNAGKTTSILKMMLNFRTENVKSFFWTGEQRPGVMRWWLEQMIAGPNFIKSRVSEKTQREYFFADPFYVPVIREWYGDYIYIYDKRGISQEQFFEVAELAIRRHQVEQIFIDNLMAYTTQEEDYYGAQGLFAQNCKMFAEDWNVHINLVAHNKKEKEIIHTLKGETQQQIVKLADKDSVEGAKKITNWADIVYQITRITDKNRISAFGDASGIWGLVKNRETELLVEARTFFEPKSKRIVQYTQAKSVYDTMGWEDVKEVEVNF